MLVFLIIFLLLFIFYLAIIEREFRIVLRWVYGHAMFCSLFPEIQIPDQMKLQLLSLYLLRF